MRNSFLVIGAPKYFIGSDFFETKVSRQACDHRSQYLFIYVKLVEVAEWFDLPAQFLTNY